MKHTKTVVWKNIIRKWQIKVIIDNILFYFILFYYTIIFYTCWLSIQKLVNWNLLNLYHLWMLHSLISSCFSSCSMSSSPSTLLPMSMLPSFIMHFPSFMLPNFSHLSISASIWILMLTLYLLVLIFLASSLKSYRSPLWSLRNVNLSPLYLLPQLSQSFQTLRCYFFAYLFPKLKLIS